MPLSVTEYKILSFFIDHANTPVYLEELAQYIWGANYDADQKDPDSLKSHISRVRNKLEKIRTGLSNCLDTNFGLRSYTLKIDDSMVGQEQGLLSSEIYHDAGDFPNSAARISSNCLPHIITKKSTYYMDERDIIHRGTDIDNLMHMLSLGKETLLISGFGGIGKTSIARVLYSKLVNQYDCVGWIEYIKDIKTSVLAAFEVYDEIQNQEYRWTAITRLLKNSEQSVLLFIDNVDSNLEKDQDPCSDRLLYEISGYPNLSIVMTSRLEELRGYHTYRIDDFSKEECEDLFYFYYNITEYEHQRETRFQRNTVCELVEQAGYHTFAIELLAKSAKRMSNLDKFAKQISNTGFRFPFRRFLTNYNDLELDAAGQLRILFNMSSRSLIEQRILWDISILPNTVLDFDEISDWLDYSVNDLDGLIKEGWLSARDGGVYMHPLVKQVVHLDLKEGKAIHGIATKLINMLYHESFFDEHDSYNVFNRKFEISNSVVAFVELKEKYIQVMQYIGEAAQKIGKIPEAIVFFRNVLGYYLSVGTDSGECINDVNLAKAYNDLGYQLSYTNSGRAEAEDFLRKALKIRENLYLEQPDLYAEPFATTCDYLGYLLSDNADTIYEGEKLLRRAFAIRKRLAKQFQGHYIHDAAWTQDNLGFLLSMMSDKYEEAEEHLRDALYVRKALEAEHKGKYLTEVAWTCSNLAFLLQVKKENLKDAEKLYREANDALQTADKEMPGVHIADIAINYNNLAVLFVMAQSRYAESKELLIKSSKIFNELDRSSPGLYSGEIAAISNNLLVVMGICANSDVVAERKISHNMHAMYALSGARIMRITIPVDIGGSLSITE